METDETAQKKLFIVSNPVGQQQDIRSPFRIRNSDLE